MVIQRNPVGSSSSTIKSRNMSAVLLMMLRYGHLSRVRLSQLTGLSTTTITNLIAELIDAGIVTQDNGEDKPRKRRGVGRPQVLLTLVPESRFALGVHFGVGSVRVAVTDLLGQVIAVDALEHPLDHPLDEVLSATAAMARQTIALSGIDVERIVGIGVGASGLVEPFAGVNVLAPNLNWRDVPLRDYFRRELALPVSVDNNVRAMALGEALFGVGKDVYSLAFVYGRIGVGAGIVVGGKLYYGGGAGAGEIGHMIIVPHGGQACRCGNAGCLETLVAEPVLIELAQEIAQREPDGLLAKTLQQGGPLLERIFHVARAGDVSTCAMLQERAYYMGLALANLVNILNPELIVLGGIFAQGQDLLLPVIKETMQQCAFANLGEKVRLESASFNHDSGVIGAAALALNHFFYQHVEGAN
jgi:predicted NBD/HSP70 family sugar kinase